MFGSLSLSREAAAWRRAGRRLRIWWRDDDADALTPDLTRLLSLSSSRGIPLALAVVPMGAAPTLPADLIAAVNAAPTVSVLQHGIDHVSRRGPDQTPAQFQDGVPSAHMAAGIIAAAHALEPFIRRQPIYAPPWNAVQPGLGAALSSLDMHLSAYGKTATPFRIDAHLDLLRWGGGAPRFRGGDRCCARLARLMRERRLSGNWNEPVGLLTHHRDHDAATWAFLESLFGRLARTRAVRWFDVGDEAYV